VAAAETACARARRRFATVDNARSISSATGASPGGGIAGTAADIERHANPTKGDNSVQTERTHTRSQSGKRPPKRRRAHTKI
jgi:hypothetical protein